MRTIWIPPGSVPGGLQTAEYLLRPLLASDVELDYEAVMESAQQLHLRSYGRWPAAGFGLEDNLRDLELHEREHRAGVAFTFTVMDPGETTCLGCVYVNPFDGALLVRDPTGMRRAPITDRDARVSFWVRSSQLADGLDRRLLDRLRSWFAEDWPLARVLFEVSPLQKRQQELMVEAGLQQHYSVEHPDWPGPYLVYG